MTLNQEKIKLILDYDENASKILSKCFLSVLKSEKTDKTVLEEIITNTKSIALG